MKVLYFHQYFKTPEMAGGTRSFEMARRLASDGHEVHMVASRPASTRLMERELMAGFEVHWIRVPYNNSMSFPRRFRAFITFAALATLVGLRHRCDVILASSTPLTIILPAVAARTLHRRPLVFEVRDLWPEVPIAMKVLRGKILISAARWLEGFAYQRSDRIVALSDGMREGILSLGYSPAKLRVIPNSCDLELFDVDAAVGRAFRDVRPWCHEGKLVVYAGSVGVVNEVEYLVHLAAETLEIDPSIRFLIVGGGGQLGSVLESARSRGVLNRTLFMEKPMAKSAMPGVMSAADLCLSLAISLPEIEANSANKFFDALAAGRPIAINYGGWQADLIREQQLGLVLPRDHRLAASELVRFLGDNGRIESARANSLEIARERFSRDQLAQQLEEELDLARREWLQR